MAQAKNQLREIQMKNAKVRYTIVLCVFYLGANAAFAQDAVKTSAAPAQAAPTLPKSFKGVMAGVNQASFQQISNALELQITSQSADGKVTGAYSRFLRYQGSPAGLCQKADNLPAEGTYDGETLILKIKGSQNSHTCDDYTITFVRAKEHYFEGKGYLAAGWTSYLDPVK